MKSLILDLRTSSDLSGTSGGDETGLFTGRRVASARRRVSDVLMVTTTMRMLHGVHRHTSNLGPAVALVLVLVVRTSRLQKRFVETSTSGNNSDHGSAVPRDGLLGAGRQTDLGLSGVLVVGNNGGRVTRALGEATAVTGFVFDVANHRTLGHRAKRKNISDSELRFSTAVDELTGVHTLGRDEEVFVQFELVGVLEDNLRERGSSAGLMDDLLHDSFDVSLLLGVVERSHFDGTLAKFGVGFKHGSRTLSLSCRDESSSLW